MKKVLIILAVLFVVGVTGTVVIGSMILGGIAKEAINVVGPKLTQTDLSVESVGLNPIFGSGSIKGFQMGNPEGFSGTTSLSLDNVELDVDVGSLFGGETIIIEKLHILGPNVAYERTFGSSNVAEVLKNVEAFKTDVLGPTNKEETGEIRFIIKELIIDGGKVGMTIAGQTLSIPMPKLEQREIGTAQGGIAPSEAVGEILSLMLKSIGSATAEASKRIANQGTDSVKKITEGIGNIFGGDK